MTALTGTASKTTQERYLPFYRSALLGLRALDGRNYGTPRFGEDADARWKNFKGHLESSDRLDLLIRDASATWNLGFSPALIFQIPGLSDDEPFGPEWTGIDPLMADRLWKEAETAKACDLFAMAAALSVTLQSFELPKDIQPASRILVAGSGAIAALSTLFKDRQDLSWHDQVLVCAESPEARQLAGLAAVVMGAQHATKVINAGGDIQESLKNADFLRVDMGLVSEDATKAERAFVEAASGKVA